MPIALAMLVPQINFITNNIFLSGLGEQELATWSASFRKIAAAAEQAKKKREAWGAICIALMTDPRFITY